MDKFIQVQPNTCGIDGDATEQTDRRRGSDVQSHKLLYDIDALVLGAASQYLSKLRRNTGRYRNVLRRFALYYVTRGNRREDARRCQQMFACLGQLNA